METANSHAHVSIMKYSRVFLRALYEAGVLIFLAEKFLYGEMKSKGKPFQSRVRMLIFMMLAPIFFPYCVYMLFRTSTAKKILVRRHNMGFFANYLAVVDILERCSSEADVYVDWSLDGTESEFCYGEVGENVWDSLFFPTHKNSTELSRAFVIKFRLNPYFYSIFREELPRRKNFLEIRRKYEAVINQNIKIRNPDVLQSIEKFWEKYFEGKYVIGVHRRLPINAVNINQKGGKSPSLEEYRGSIESQIRASERKISDIVIFLATDDIEAVEYFDNIFGEVLVFQKNIQRISASKGKMGEEVHTQPWEKVSIQDAIDVLVDTTLLSRCNELIHVSSNISTSVALMNSKIELVKI